SIDQTVRQVRHDLLDAIEQFHPSADLPLRARERRAYQILFGYYVQGIKTDELVEELAISVRQLRREHKRALNALTDLIWDRFSARYVAQEGSALSQVITDQATRRDAAVAEAEQLIVQTQAENLDLPALAQSLLDMLTPI